MKTLKHLFTALLLLLSVAVNAHDFAVDGIYYNITDATNKTVAVTYRGGLYNDYSNEYTGSVVIPETVVYNGTTYSVTSIRNFAFEDCDGLTSVVIGNSVTSIGSSAFSGCSGLKEVRISDLVAWCNIEFGDFYANPLSNASNLYLNGDLITDLVIPDNVTEIKIYAFYNCSGLTSVVIPNSVTSIGDYAFYKCSGLESVCNLSKLTFTGGSAAYGYVAYYAYKVINAPNGFIAGDFVWIENESGMTLASYLGNATELTLPTQYNGKSVTSIRYSAFRDCSGLTSVVIPNSVTNIGEDAFSNCSGLTSVVIGNSVTSIGDNAFYNCSGLTSVVIGNSVTSIGDEVFYGCSGLASIEIPNSVTSIGGAAFYGCKSLKDLRIEDGDDILSLGSYELNFFSPFGKYYGLFHNCPLETLYLGRDLGYDNSNAHSPFYNISMLTSVTIGNSVTSIGEDTFQGCSGLTNIVIPNSVKSIGYAAFAYCSGLTSVVIGNSVTSIGDYAFYECSGLESVCNLSNLTFTGGSAAYGYVAYYAYKVINAPNGFIAGDFVWIENESGMTLAGYLGNATELTLPTQYNGKCVTSIGYKAFYSCSGLTSVVIPNSVTSIGNSAFAICRGLASVVIGNSVTSIGNSAFASCFGLTSVVIPNSVTSIGDYAFAYCRGLTSVIIGNSVTSIGNSAFEDCSGLKEVRISDLVAWCNIDFGGLSANPLYYANNLYLNGDLITDLVIPDNVTEIKNSAFYNCSGLTSVVIPNSVTSIGNYAFDDCDGLTSVEIPNSVTSIGYAAFRGCSGLTSVEIPNSVTSIGNCAFYGCTSLKDLRIEGGDGILYLGYNSYNSYGTAEGLFYDCPLETLYLGRNLNYETEETYGYSPFYKKSTLTSVTIGNSVTSIPTDAFSGCTSLKNLRIEDGDGILFLGSNTQSYYGLFCDCPLETLYLGRDLSYSYGYPPFYNISTLTSVTIGNSVTSIGASAFYGCSSLKEVRISDLVAWCNIDFGGSSANPLYYANNLYLNGDLITDLVIPDNVTEIKNSAFYNCSGLTSVVIPNSITSIGPDAFHNCSGLKEVHISDFVAWLNIDFGNAYANPLLYAKILYLNGDLITDLVIPDNVTEIKQFAFCGCSGLTNVEIPGGVTSIGSSAFNRCSGLTNIAICDGVKTVGEYAFYNSSNLETLYIGNTIESIGDYAFFGCDKIKEIKVGLKKPIRGSENIFANATYDNATLYVPNGTKSLYEKREPWILFFYIAEMDFTGIDEVFDELEGEDGKVEGVYYDLNGRVVENPVNGIYIIDGKKVWVK